MSSVENAPTIMDRLSRSETQTLKFKVPDSHPEAGEEKTSEFTYPFVISDEQALEVITFKEWTIQELVNDRLKSQARANAYQNATAPFRNTLSADDIAKRTYSDLIRAGFSEEFAKNQSENLRTLTLQNLAKSESGNS